MSIDTSMQIAILEITRKIDHSKPLADRLKDSMRLAQKHWLVTEEEKRFRVSVGAVMLGASKEDRSILENEMMALGRFSSIVKAVHDGVIVDVVESMKGIDVDTKLIGLMKIWNYVKGESG